MNVGCYSWLVFLLGCILLGDCAIEQCTRESSFVICKGRCAAAAVKNLTIHADCLTKCCNGASQDTTYPPDCPLLQLNCSGPITPHAPPQVTWKQGRAVLLYEDSHLAAGGRNACDPISPMDGNTLPVVVSADNTAFWLIIPGKENVLSLLYSGCHNISVASVSECGMSAFISPAQVAQPPALTLVAKSIRESALEAQPSGRSFPNITVSWTLSESEYAENIMVNVTMIKTPSSKQEGCLTASKVYQAQRYPFDESINFLPQDFEGTSVWLCHYDIMVSISYRDACTLAEGSVSGTRRGEQITLPYNIGVSASGELVWNQTDATYNFKAKWTVPRTYNLPETITSFRIASLLRVGHHFFLEDQNFRKEVPATGNSNYEACIYGLPPTKEGLAFRVQFRNPIRFGQHVARLGPFDALGEPPSQVELTNVSNLEGGGVRVTWKAPSIPNGVIQSYHVQVQLLNKDGHFVFEETYTVTGNITSYFFKLSEVSDEGKLHASHQVSIRVAAQNAFLFSNFSDASYVNLATPMEEDNNTVLLATPMEEDNKIVLPATLMEEGNKIVLPAVIVPVLALLFIISLTVLVISLVKWKLHRNAQYQYSKTSLAEVYVHA